MTLTGQFFTKIFKGLIDSLAFQIGEILQLLTEVIHLIRVILFHLFFVCLANLLNRIRTLQFQNAHKVLLVFYGWFRCQRIFFVPKSFFSGRIRRAFPLQIRFLPSNNYNSAIAIGTCIPSFCPFKGNMAREAEWLSAIRTSEAIPSIDYT